MLEQAEPDADDGVGVGEGSSLVFVYGTLLTGLRNHGALRGGELLGEGVTLRSDEFSLVRSEASGGGAGDSAAAAAEAEAQAEAACPGAQGGEYPYLVPASHCREGCALTAVRGEPVGS